MTHRQTSNEPVVVIGSGPAGAMAAARLVERGLDVLMLDSADRAPSGIIVRAAGNTLYRRRDDSLLLDDRLAAGSSHPSVWYSSLTKGGLSNYWTGAVPRFAPRDFDEGGRIDERYVWPVGYDDLAPYYDEVERRIVVTAGEPIIGVPHGNLRHRWRPPADWREVIDRVQSTGEGLGVVPMAKGDPWMVARRGTEFASYHCIVQPLESDPRFTLRTGAHVTRLVWSSADDRVTEVEYIDRASGVRMSTPASAVVVAAGAIDSTMILLRSRSDDHPAGLGNSSDTIGRYLHDHPRRWWRVELDRDMRALSHPLYLARDDHEDAVPLMGTSHTIGLVAPVERLKTYVRASTGAIGVQLFGTMVPEADFRVELPTDDDTPDPVGVRPRVTIAYDSVAVENVRRAQDRLRDALGSAGLGVRIDDDPTPLTPGSSVHFGGTVRMHRRPEFGALDEWNRMHDVRNVVVCDLSCFTTGAEKNPTPTSMALAARAADRLAADL